MLLKKTNKLLKLPVLKFSFLLLFTTLWDTWGFLYYALETFEEPPSYKFALNLEFGLSVDQLSSEALNLFHLDLLVPEYYQLKSRNSHKARNSTASDLMEISCRHG